MYPLHLVLTSFLPVFVSLFRFVLSLENDLTVRSKTTEISIEDFSSGSYATIFGDEVVLLPITQREHMITISESFSSVLIS